MLATPQHCLNFCGRAVHRVLLQLRALQQPGVKCLLDALRATVVHLTLCISLGTVQPEDQYGSRDSSRRFTATSAQAGGSSSPVGKIGAYQGYAPCTHLCQAQAWCALQEQWLFSGVGHSSWHVPAPDDDGSLSALGDVVLGGTLSEMMPKIGGRIVDGHLPRNTVELCPSACERQALPWPH